MGRERDKLRESRSQVSGTSLARPREVIVNIGDSALRAQITEVVSNALQPLPYVLAGWESGSVASDRADDYSDIDLNFLLNDASPVDPLYAAVESALETVSPVAASHTEPPGRYFKLIDGGEFLLVDVCIFRAANLGERLDIERHGRIRPLFDKGQWLRRDSSTGASQVARRAERLEELQAWFSVSQSFVRKAILRGQKVEALAAFWGYTLKPLVELLRIRYCPPRWDFGMRYLDRDLPGPVYVELQSIMGFGEHGDLAAALSKATAWGEQLLRELKDAADSSPRAG